MAPFHVAGAIYGLKYPVEEQCVMDNTHVAVQGSRGGPGCVGRVDTAPQLMDHVACAAPALRPLRAHVPALCGTVIHF